jgi:hypothetical protein
MAIRAFLLLIVLSSSSYLTLSLFEDQVGLMDWHQQYIGKVKQAVFHTQKAGRKRVVVSTEENVIASLDLRRGDIFWRHVLGSNDVIDEMSIALGKYVVTLSTKGSILRAWNLPDGQLVWESFLLGSKTVKSLLLIPENLKLDNDYIIFVYGSGILYAISGIDGEVIWKKDLDPESIEVQHIVHLRGSDTVYAVGFAGESEFHTYKINAKNGGLLKHEIASVPGGLFGEITLVSSTKFVILDSTRSKLTSISIKDGEISLKQTDTSDFVPGSSGIAVLLPAKLVGIFALRVNTVVSFIKVTDELGLKIEEQINNAIAISDALSFSEGQQAFGLIQHGDSKIHLSVKLGLPYNGDLLKESVGLDRERGIVQKLFVNNYVKTDRSYGFRALIVMEDHSLLLLQQGDIVWIREDGLASIIDITTSELPVEKDGVSVAKVEHSLFEWLQGHMLKLKGTLMLANADDVAAIQKIRLQNSEKSKMTRDRKGFRKLLLALTKSGKLFALHTGDGRIVWSRLLDSLQKSDTCESPIGLKVHQWRVPHHHAMDENPSVLVVGRCGITKNAPVVFSIVDTYTGKEIKIVGPAHSIAQIIPLPFTDSSEQRLHVVIDFKKRVHLYPRTSEALSIFKRELDNFYWYSVVSDNGVLKGHSVKKISILEEEDEFCFESKDLWSIVFPSESEKIISSVTRKLNEVVHTQAKVAAEQDLMYKYISKNVVFVATVSPNSIAEIGSVTPEESQLVIYLIDTITGRVLNRIIHHGSQGPVHAVFSENWVIYHYFNLRAHRYEMSVIEIYDQSRAENKDIMKLISGNHDLSSPVTSFSRPEVITKSQSYFFPHSLKSISVTLTAKGITSKQLLVGTIGDQVLALDKRFLDPRRSLNPSQAEKEEGILPLAESLPIIPQSYVTHSLKVEKLKGIETIPTKLESTTLVFSYGLDLFFTRLAPSRTYDSLTEDFSYALLLLTILVLVIAIVATWILSERKDLQEKWR